MSSVEETGTVWDLKKSQRRHKEEQRNSTQDTGSRMSMASCTTLGITQGIHGEPWNQAGFYKQAGLASENIPSTQCKEMEIIKKYTDEQY